MKLLDVLVRQGAPRGAAARNISFDQYLQLAQAFTFDGHSYSGIPGVTTTMSGEKAEAIDANFYGYVEGMLKSNGIVFTCEAIRVQTFSEARFQFRAINDGRPGDLFGTSALTILQKPWEGGTTGDLLARMLLDADLAGNSYDTVIDNEVVHLRPDWVDIILAARMAPVGRDGQMVPVGFRKVGYAYYEGGRFSRKSPAIFLPREVCHFAPQPDPTASFRGMSWMTPIVREVQADGMFTGHKLRFMENAATPNLAVSLAKEISPEAFELFVDKMDDQHQGADNAYKTLYTAGGADVTVIGSTFDKIDFRNVQGALETRIAAASGVHPVIAALSEGLQGSSLNAGNFAAARRRFADITMRPLWRNVSGSLATIVPPPSSAELWFDERDIAFLREDEADAANIQGVRASTITALIREGFTAESSIAAVDNDDFRLLVHSGLVSVQLQAPGAGAPNAGSDARSLVEMVQKVYLGVGTVLSADEARQMLNQAGAGLSIPGPLSAPAA